MLDEKLEVNVKFSEEMGKFLDTHFDELFDATITSPDIDFIDGEEEDLVEFETNESQFNVIVNEKKLKNKIASMILEDRISSRLMEREYETSKNTQVIGYE